MPPVDELGTEERLRINRQVEPLPGDDDHRAIVATSPTLTSRTSDIVITDRPSDYRFPKIPAGVGEGAVSWEAGCADPIAQARPTSVVGIAASTARFVIDVLTERELEDTDVVEVYRPLEGTDFDIPCGQSRLPVS